MLLPALAAVLFFFPTSPSSSLQLTPLAWHQPSFFLWLAWWRTSALTVLTEDTARSMSSGVCPVWFLFSLCCYSSWSWDHHPTFLTFAFRVFHDAAWTPALSLSFPNSTFEFLGTAFPPTLSVGGWENLCSPVLVYTVLFFTFHAF